MTYFMATAPSALTLQLFEANNSGLLKLPGLKLLEMPVSQSADLVVPLIPFILTPSDSCVWEAVNMCKPHVCAALL